MEIYTHSWWSKVPSRCSCGKKVMSKADGKFMIFICREHGIVVKAAKEMKRNGTIDWHYYRLFKDYNHASSSGQQLSLL